MSNLAAYRRFIISHFDLLEAAASCKRLLEMDEFDLPLEEQSPDFHAHFTQLVIAYARPFSKHHHPDIADKRLSGEVRRSFSSEESRLHKRLCDLRKQEFAHSDPKPTGLTVEVRETETGRIVLPLSRVTRRASLSRGDVEMARGMIYKLQAAVWAHKTRLEAELPVGRHSIDAPPI